ncbi:MAG: hypothetical protein K8S25_01180 [Alphaproteobacteria bacterium]|nr:hypothetical protein [Alphaproteobacteria bacterium]
MALPQNDFGFFEPGGGDDARRRGLSFGIALCVHAVVLFALVSLVSPRFSEPPERKSEPRIVAVAVRIAPPPPNVDLFGPEDVVLAQPRFRPRAPMVVRQQRKGDPALAVWKYLCNRATGTAR